MQLDTYAVFSERDLLSQVAVERILAGVATRRHALVAEPIGEELEEVARGDSKSARLATLRRRHQSQAGRAALR